MYVQAGTPTVALSNALMEHNTAVRVRQSTEMHYFYKKLYLTSIIFDPFSL
jgi:hypothetical protein